MCKILLYFNNKDYFLKKKFWEMLQIFFEITANSALNFTKGSFIFFSFLK